MDSPAVIHALARTSAHENDFSTPIFIGVIHALVRTRAHENDLPHPYFHRSINMQDDPLVALLLLACDCTGEDVQACLFRGIDGQLGDVDVAWLLKRLDDDTRDFLCL